MFNNIKSNMVLFCLLISVFTLQFLAMDSFAGTPGPDEWSYAVADFNGDGSPDVFIASGTGRGDKIWFNNGMGEFYPSDQILDYSIVGSIAVGDIDNDGDTDIFVINIDSPNQVWLNDGTGHFILSGQVFDTHRSISVSLGDIDSDGDLDAAVAYANGMLEIFSNNGAGFFIPVQFLNGGKGITSIEFKDISNDKISDIVCFTNSNAVSAFINSGNSQFSRLDGKVEIATTLSEASVDLTGDGKPDGVFINNEGEPSPANYYGDHPLLGATGGPDSYGYVWINIPYSWINATANSWTAPAEDSVTGAIPLGFTFNFYENDYTSVYIASDGYVQFSDPHASTDTFWPMNSHSAGRPNNAAYGFGTDLDPTAGGRIRYESSGSAPNRYFVVTYEDIYTVNDDNQSNFEIVLFETANSIYFTYKYVTPDYGYATVGIEDENGSRYLSYCHLYCYPVDSSSIRFYPAPEIELYRSGTDIPTGSSYNFGRVAVGSSDSVTFTITNTGRADLNLSGTSITGTNAGQFGITTSPLSPVAALSGSTSVTVRFQPTAEGVMEAQLRIANDDPSENPYIINLYGGGDDNAPTVDITNPADGSTVAGTVNIDADAADDIGISLVQFYRDNTLIGTDMTAPYGITYDFSGVSPGTYIIKAIAFDTLNQTAMDVIKVTVAGVGPTVNITNPADGAAVFNVVNIEASATAISGVDRVDFRVNGSLLCSDNTAPYQCSWDTRLLPYGDQTISAVAVDTHGLTAVDTITVRTTDAPPEVKITEPASAANIFGTTVIKADAWDNSRVMKVDFHVNSALLCSDTKAPYECEWDALEVPVGIYTIKAVATDNIGQTGTDTITVQRRVQVNLSVMRKTEKAWIIRKDYAEIHITLPDYGVANVGRMHVLRSDGGIFESIKEILISDIQNNSIQFLDSYLDSEKEYTYKVIVFDSNWQSIGESDLITI